MRSVVRKLSMVFVAAALSVGCALVGAESLASAAAQSPARPANAGAVPVEIVSTGEARYTMLRGGTPYLIKGAGLHLRDLESFAAHGGNSIRTWTTDGGQEVLDTAHKLGITVILCIDIGRERLGFDYDNPAAVRAQLEFARQEVIKYKDHPALLAWMIGNEPDMKFTNPKVFDAINDISRMIHEVDGNHPTTTALAQFRENGRLVETRAPDLDFISIQMYKGILNLPHFILETGLRKPYLVTEYGGVGFWKEESEWTAWGAPIELNSSQKAEHFRLAYRTAIESAPGQIAGSYVFLWGHKQERTPTWFGFLLADGSYTESVEVAHTIWNGAAPANTAPRIAGITLDGKVANQDVVLASGQRYGAKVLASDGENDALSYRWVLKRESTATQDGGDAEEIPEQIFGRIGDAVGGKVSLSAPVEPGAYRLFVYAHDGRGYAGYANIPFLVR